MIDYVLVRAKKPRLSDVRDALTRLPSVREVHPLIGEWDFILKVQAEPALDGADVLWAVSSVADVIETKWLGVSRIGPELRVASNLSNTQMRSGAL